MINGKCEFSAEDEALGRAAFEGFAETMQEWMPTTSHWDGLSPHVKKGWIAAWDALSPHVKKGWIAAAKKARSA